MKQSIVNSATLYEDDWGEDYFEIAVKKKKQFFEGKYPKCGIKETRCKAAVRIIVYEKERAS